MTQASLLSTAHQSPTKSSRLVRFLAELLDADVQLSHQRFIERLGQSFDLADSIKISAVHAKKIEATETPPEAEKDAVKDEFQRVRASIISSAVQSFEPGASGMRTRFPELRAETATAETMSAEPYLAFYVAQQRNIDFRIRDLHAATRDALTTLSPQLARLAALDAVLADPLLTPARRSFIVVPRLLRRRFDTLLEDLHSDNQDESNTRERWEQSLAQFRQEMQGLLLAEIETRLLPTLGLIEALDELNDNDDY
ncbi:Uncharacterised protein [Halioglobus japonicus]|nr:Uncharacterised protein [Halioglobus japonicus]